MAWRKKNWINRRILLLNKVFTFKESVAQDAGDHSLQGKQAVNSGMLFWNTVQEVLNFISRDVHFFFFLMKNMAITEDFSYT